MSLRLRSAMLGIVVSLLVGAASPLLAAEQHATCAARSHACGATTRLVKCCCPDGAHGPSDAAPAPAKVEIARSVATAPVAVAIEAPAHITISRDAIRPSPPHFAALDRQSLFGSFLI